MISKVYFNGVGLVTAIGNNVAEIAKQGEKGESRPSTIEISQSEVNTRMPYFSINQPNVDVGPARIYQIIDKAVAQAVEDSGLTTEQLSRAGLFIGSTSFDMNRCESAIKASSKTDQDIADQIPTFNCLAEYISSKFIINGPAYTFNTACTSSANALLYAADFIRSGDITHALVLGVEFFNEITTLGFSGLDLISETGMKPFDETRDGLILGEGCGAVIISAQEKLQGFAFLGGANISDNYSITASNPNGKSIQKVIQQALDNTELNKQDIALVKAHGTASLSNDDAEAAGLEHVFGDAIPPIVALKPLIGHTLGACGINELILFMESLKRKKMIAYASNVASDYPLDIAIHSDIPQKNGHYLLNYFGFGGNNTVLVIADA
jgi:3-oxoacyl-[acyl-carrier-protein] synthase-1